MPSRRASPVDRLDVTPDRLHALLSRLQPHVPAEDYRELQAIVDTLIHVAGLLEKKRASIRRLRALLFGACTETTRKVLATVGLATRASPGGEGRAVPDTRDGSRRDPSGGDRRKGHGRHGAASYVGGRRIAVPHPTLQPGDRCPNRGCAGKVYTRRDPHVLVRFVAQAPIGVTVVELDTLRCNLCGELFTAPTPEGVGDEKHDASTGAMVALLRYGTGLPFNRLAKLQASVGIPLPASTQWDLVVKVAQRLGPAWEALKRQAADGQILYNDDTPMRVLSLMRSPADPASDPPEPPDDAADSVVSGDVSPDRTGTFTSGIVADCGDHRIALFFTGRRHAGENLGALLATRTASLPPPIQMCDGLAHNTPKDFAGIVSNCLAHARRGAVDVTPAFPDECRYVLETLRDVYAVDDRAKTLQLSPHDRLVLHQTHSQPLMDDLHRWCRTQIDDHLVEPNSGLGDAIQYFLKRWDRLTRFLTVEGAPLDNSMVERALKRAILHRKGSLFYKTLNGAGVGDLFMSLIHTCDLNRVNPFEYLIALQEHAKDVQATPTAWMPWTYRHTLEQLRLVSRIYG
jgi:transposase